MNGIFLDGIARIYRIFLKVFAPVASISAVSLKAGQPFTQVVLDPEGVLLRIAAGAGSEVTGTRGL